MVSLFFSIPMIFPYEALVELFIFFFNVTSIVFAFAGAFCGSL